MILISTGEKGASIPSSSVLSDDMKSLFKTSSSKLISNLSLNSYNIASIAFFRLAISPLFLNDLSPRFNILMVSFALCVRPLTWTFSLNFNSVSHYFINGVKGII